MHCSIVVQADAALTACFFLMDGHTLLHHFRYIISLASLAYTFTILHAIQYSMRDHNDINNTTAQTPQDYDSTNPSASTYDTVDTPTNTSMSETIEKSSGWWTENKVKLLLDYVEENCTLTTARGLNLKKSEFNKARTTVKSKDASQCHYKWGHVCIFSIVISMRVFITYSVVFLH